MVDSVAGTTRDPVDELIELGGTTWRFVDTAGIRRRFRESQGADYYAALRTAGALDRAEVAVVLIDASEPLTEQDLRIITMVIEAGRALVIAYNKWDMIDEERRHYLEREIERQLYHGPLGAAGEHLRDHRPAHGPAGARRSRRRWRAGRPGSRPGSSTPGSTGLVAATPPPVRGGKQPRILFATQAGDQAAALRAVRLGLPRGRPTAGSSSGGCARSSASTAARFRCPCGSGPSARAGAGTHRPPRARSVAANRRERAPRRGRGGPGGRVGHRFRTRDEAHEVLAVHHARRHRVRRPPAGSACPPAVAPRLAASTRLPNLAAAQDRGVRDQAGVREDRRAPSRPAPGRAPAARRRPRWRRRPRRRAAPGGPRPRTPPRSGGHGVRPPAKTSAITRSQEPGRSLLEHRPRRPPMYPDCRTRRSGNLSLMSRQRASSTSTAA